MDGTTEDLAAQVALLTRQVAELQQVVADRAVSGGGQGQPPLYATVEEWVRDYLLPGFPRPVGEVGLVR
ncbi:hypothetical protein [Micromonospora sp. M71_S20]|uniref:hypothetical protein n=1 Tax=Micromonospora sp. M71_S20 TaxID=592872 RepID=UPI001F2B7D2F|nr:hypothetical protein [Micromonospora sp. M71_S20]